MKIIRTVDDVIDALGGNLKASKLLGVKYNSITNWKMFGRFPSDTYVLVQDQLMQRGQVAPDELWRMRPPKRKARAGR